MNYFSTFLALLKDRQSFLEEIHDRVQLGHKITALMLCSFLCFAVYGAIIGSFHSPLQSLSSAIKLPALYLITLTVCLPALYVFNALFGSRKTIGQHFTYVLSAASVIALLLCGFAPVTMFFLMTLSMKDYSFYLLLNVTIFAITGIFGISFLYQAMRPIVDGEKDENVKIRTNILKFWLVLYGFVGSQLGWTLRPFFGSTTGFELFRPKEGNFLTGVWTALRHVLGGG
ncbi:hypothetical protein ACN4EG_25050 [Alkalinema pantanalense CENA528]|uniref:hypothetical protein n=1 Tax=Alkalinema pantanalense TaxID=1620705 RepID=UPI003D6E4E40